MRIRRPFQPFAFAGMLLFLSMSGAAAALAATLPSRSMVLAAPASVAGEPTALAAADLDGDGVPDLIVSYATPDGSELVVYPGDAAAIYPPADAPRAVTASPFKAARVLGEVPGWVEALLTYDVDADGVKDVIAEGALGRGAVLLAGRGDGTVAAAAAIDEAAVAIVRARIAALAPAVPLTASTLPLSSIPDAVAQRAPNGATGGYRRSSATKAALAKPATPPALTPPADAFAVLPMRLNRDAIPDLVVLRPGAPAPEVIVSLAATTFTVTVTKDENNGCDAKCSLREAIIAANATPDADVIEFAIPTTDPGFQPATGTWRIQPKTEYPVITQPVTIDARTQPGFAGQPLIELDGSKAPKGTIGFIVNAPTSVIRGFVVNNFPAFIEPGTRDCGCGIIIDGGTGCIVEGNYSGTDVTGTQARPNGLNGISIVTGQNNLIGGTTPQARNIASGNVEGFTFHNGISTFISSGANNNTIAGNYVGVDRSGYNALGNEFGILLNSPNNTIGGTDPGSGNVVAGNTADMIVVAQIDVSAAGNKILRNFIGVNAPGTTAFDVGFNYGINSSDANSTTVGMPGAGNLIAGNDYGVYFSFSKINSTSGHVIQGNTIGIDALGRPLPNNGPGIRMDNCFDSTIGGTGNGEGNVIANNKGEGVQIGFYVGACQGCSGPTLGNHNRILSNRIYNNAYSAFLDYLGINLVVNSFSDQVTANDADDSDSGPNDFLNWPVLTSASSTAISSQINAQALTCGPACAQNYTLQFFASPACDTSGNGEGQVFLGQASKAANGSPVVVNLGVPIPNGWFVTATATDSLNNTSEFSNCVQALGGPQPTISATPTEVPTATPTATPLPGQTATRSPTPTVTPTNIPGNEDCGNCRDDDGDSIVDRTDPDCPVRANGGGAGIGDPARAKALVKCQKGLTKAGAVFALKKQKILQGCLQQVLACVEQKPGDAGCLTKAGGKCQKGAAGIAKLETKLTTSVGKVCGDPPVAIADLKSLTGVGFNADTATCMTVQVPALTSAADIALCLGRRHECQVEQLVSEENPRAHELLGLAGLDPTADFPCVAAGADGAGQGIADTARAKALAACAKGLQKAAGSFVKVRLGGLQKCLEAVTVCEQQKSGDAACIAKAQAKCAKIAAKIGDAPKGAGDKARAAIAKACANADPADLVVATGLGQTGAASYCAAIGVPALTSAADVAECVVRHHSCRTGQFLDAEAPRARELLGIVGVTP